MTTTRPGNVTPLTPPRKELAWNQGWRQVTLRFGDALLAIESRLGRQQRVERHDLLLLNPLFVFEAYAWASLAEPLRRFALTLALAAIVQFSRFGADVPLLAPALAAGSVYWFVRLAAAWRANGPRTVICDTSGSVVIEVPHAATDEASRLGFEAALRKAIETRDARWHNGEL